MQRTVEKAFFALIRFEINGGELCDDVKNSITPDVLPPLFRLSKRHDLAHLVGDALDKNGLLPDGTEAKKRFLKERDLAVYRYEYQNYELEQICKTLEKAEIPFVPLKGSVIRKYYPEPWMRTSCDIDILVREEDLSVAVNSLQTELSYQYERKGSHDVSLTSVSGVNLELHYFLGGDSEPWNQVLKRSWMYSSPKTNYNYALTQEMFYFYHVAHMAGHFKIGGCGVRPFLDLYLIRSKVSLNNPEITNLLLEGGLAAFNKAACWLSDFWFANGEISPTAHDLEHFVLYAGMYGDIKNRVAISKVKKGSCFKAVCARICIPHSELKHQYPILQKYRVLLPFCQIRRWFNLLSKEQRVRAMDELKIATNEDVKREKLITELLKELEI